MQSSLETTAKTKQNCCEHGTILGRGWMNAETVRAVDTKVVWPAKKKRAGGRDPCPWRYIVRLCPTWEAAPAPPVSPANWSMPLVPFVPAVRAGQCCPPSSHQVPCQIRPWTGQRGRPEHSQSPFSERRTDAKQDQTKRTKREPREVTRARHPPPPVSAIKTSLPVAVVSLNPSGLLHLSIHLPFVLQTTPTDSTFLTFVSPSVHFFNT